MNASKRIYCTEEYHHSGGAGLFFLQRAEQLLPELIREYRGQVQLIYLDPPFGTGDTFQIKIGNNKGNISIPAYKDNMSTPDYTKWMRDILIGCKDLLSDTGCIYVHVDYRFSAETKLLLDDIFGKTNFVNEIIWAYKSGGRSTRYYPRKHDTILFYRKSGSLFFDIAAVGVPRGASKRNHMKRFVDENGRVCFSIRSNGRLYTYYEDTPVYPTDVWTDIEHLQQRDKERTGYPTQKPEALLKRIIAASSKAGDLVCDLFSGSGTTAVVASKMGRRFIAADASPVSLYMLRKRLLAQGSVLSLIEGENDMLLCYPVCNIPASADYSIETVKDGRRMLTLRSASFDDAYPIVYIALGSVSGERFTPLSVNCDVTFPTRFDMPDIDHPVIEFVDAKGHYAFFEM